MHLSGSDYPDVLLNCKSVKRVVHKRKSFPQRHSHGITELNGSRSCTSFSSIYGDKIRQYSCLNHGFADRKELTLLTNTQFKPNRFSIGKLSQFFNKIQKADRRIESLVVRR